jgi:hypothetical protein
MVLIYQPPNAHVWILLRNVMAAAAAVKKIYTIIPYSGHVMSAIVTQ